MTSRLIARRVILSTARLYATTGRRLCTSASRSNVPYVPWGPCGPPLAEMSKRKPDMRAVLNTADRLEADVQRDGFSKWGFIVYRCTYESNSDWKAFMHRIYKPVTKQLDYYNGLDLLDSFAPTVMEDPMFAGASMADLRAHFKTWSQRAFYDENPRLALNSTLGGERMGRYRFFIAVDQHSLQSVLNAPEGIRNQTGYVRYVRADWDPEEVDEDGEPVLEEDSELEPIDGLRLVDVGWMKVPYHDAQLMGYYHINYIFDWEKYYERPPEIMKYL